MSAISNASGAGPALKGQPGLALCLGVLLLTGLVVVGPFLVNGVGPSDSVIFNTVWVQEFTAAMRRGDLTPRWLPGAFHGLGAPSFYYYPPLAFYVAAGVDFLTGHGLDALRVTALANLVLSIASGAGMFAWLRDRAGNGWAVAGAVVYMVAPYHTIDFYFRGAFAEVAATAVLPWFLLALERAARDWRGIPALALAYAALILSHLPSALLATLFLVPAVVGWRLWTTPAGKLALAGRCLAGGVLGLALAAGYLGPALLLQDAAQLVWMWGGEADAWTLFNFDRWPSKDFMKRIALCSWCAGAAGLAAILAAFDAPRRRTAAPAMLFGAVAVFATLLHATPWIWTVKPLMQVQFAYRIVVISEFAAVAAVCLAAVSGRPRRLAGLLVAPAALAAWVFALMAPSIRIVAITPVDPGGMDLIAAGRAPNEHLPAGYFPYPDWVDPNLLNGFPETPLVALDDGRGKVVAASGFPDGSVAMDLDLPAPTRVVVKRFHFPSWRAERLDGRRKTALKVGPGDERPFVSFEAQAGRHVYRVRQAPTTVERISDALALVALLVVIGLLAPQGLRALRAFAGRQAVAA